MTTMDQIHRIRELYYEQGKNLQEIATIMNCDWSTARKYVDMEDFNKPAPLPESGEDHESKLDSFKPLIDSWLEADKLAPRKQRHTAKRIYKRLQDETNGFNCSYRLVAGYVKEKKEALKLNKTTGYIPLQHRPGEAQADFGTADFYENGKLHHEAKYFVLSFPYSNGGFLQLNYGENMECLLEGMIAIFEHIGGVPTEIWFDNTRTIVTEIVKGGERNVTERFQRFCEHYRIKALFMNPESGWEKGNVENKVGYLRRNELVPIPRFDDLHDKNHNLLSRCDDDMLREHYEDNDNRFISELFEEDKSHLLPLPSIPFDTANYITARTDKYGKFTLDAGKHKYSVSPAFCESVVNLKLTSSHVIVMDKDMHEIVRHKRLYGSDNERMDWIPYLTYIAKKPRSLRNSGIYEMMPRTMQIYIDNCESNERGKILKVLAELTERTGFASAVNTVDEAVRRNATDPDSLKSLYRRTYAEVPLLPPLDNTDDFLKQKIIPFRNDELSVLDAALARGGVSNG